MEAAGLDDFNNNLQLQSRLLLLHCTRFNEVADLATKALGVLVKRLNSLDPSLFDLWWHVTMVCTKSNDSDIETVNGYVLWLRCINDRVLELSLKNLQIVFDTEIYWELLIQGLLNKSYDIRKYTLHILAQSLQKIDHNINNRTMFWDTSKTKKLFWEWERYATLVNIVSIDTSIHQAGDSAADIVKLIGKGSSIPKSWARCLLSTGLKSSTDSIRTFVSTVTLSLTTEDMEIFLDGFDFLTHTLLPQLMLASNFAVRREKVDEEYMCVYGDKLSTFIESILKYLDDTTASNMSQALMKYLHEERYSFDPARLYVVRGIECGLRNRKVLSAINLETLVHLFHTFAESELRSRVFYFLYFRLFFYVSDSVSAKEWFSAVATACSFQNFLFHENKASVLEFVQSRPSFVTFFTQDAATVFEALDVNPAILYLEINHLIKGKKLLDSVTSRDVDFYLSFMAWPESLIYSTAEYQSDFIEKFSATAAKILHEEPLYPLFIEKVSQNWESLVAAPWFQIDTLKSTEIVKAFENAQSVVLSEETLVEVTRYLTLVNIGLKFSIKDFSSFIDVSFVVDFATKIIKTKVPDRNNMPNKHAALLETHKVINTLLDTKVIISSLSKSQIAQLFDVLSSNFEFVNFPCRIEICQSILKLVDFHGNSDNISNSTLNYSLDSLWSALAVDRLIATERSLHILFLNFALHTTIIQKSIHDEELSFTLQTVLGHIVELSYARRCLLPHLTKKLLEYLIYSSSKENGGDETLPLWIGQILTRIYTFNQVDDNIFRLEVVVSHLFDNHPLSLATQGGVSSYLREYGCYEIDARIYSAIFFSALKTENACHKEFAQSLYRYILHGENTPYNVFEVRKRNDGLEESERIRALQILLLLSRFFDTRDFDSDMYKDLESNFQELLPLLDTEPSPVARVYIEWLMTRFNVSLIASQVASGKQNVVSNNRVLTELDKYNESPRVIGSLERVGLLTARSLMVQGHDVTDSYYQEYISKLVPFSSSNRATVRHSAVSMLIALEGEFKSNTDKRVAVDPQVMDIINRICDNARASDSFKQYRSGENSIWKPVFDYNLVGICGGVIRKVCDRHIGVITLDQLKKCSYSVLGTEKSGHLELEVPAGFAISYSTWETQEEEDAQQVQTSSNANTTKTTEPAPLQTKSGFWNSVIDLSLGETGRDSDKVERGELIVVASLVDKAPNLGGICRLCDVLGAKLLCLNDLTVSKNIQFKTVAVTADRWMPMTEVREGSALIDFMMEKKKEGYTLIGLEQTDKSVELNADLKFPKKSLILLGKEREGIPGEYLAELDTCVEIKQVGVIRSMNIQTATAVIVHAYSIQHC